MVAARALVTISAMTLSSVFVTRLFGVNAVAHIQAVGAISTIRTPFAQRYGTRQMNEG